MSRSRPGVDAVQQARSLWDVEDASDVAALHVRDMIVGPVSSSDVDEFCHRYHYAVSGGNRHWRWGLWHGLMLMGVVAYNPPPRPVCESVFGAEHAGRVWNMGRLAVAEQSPRNSESRLIGGSLRSIERDFPDVWAVITYAATDQGHVGYVYQATNAIYTGTGGHSTYHVDGLGNRRADYFGPHSMTAAGLETLGWTTHPSAVKHRYIYILGDRRQRRDRLRLLTYPALPYPKGSDGE